MSHEQPTHRMEFDAVTLVSRGVATYSIYMETGVMKGLIRIFPPDGTTHEFEVVPWFHENAAKVSFFWHKDSQTERNTALKLEGFLEFLHVRKETYTITRPCGVCQ